MVAFVLIPLSLKTEITYRVPRTMEAIKLQVD